MKTCVIVKENIWNKFNASKEKKYNVWMNDSRSLDTSHLLNFGGWLRLQNKLAKKERFGV